MTCPYCNSKYTTSVIYLYRYNDNNTFVKKNYQLINQEIITDKDKIKILDSITNSKINFWNKEYINKDYDNYKWILKLEYYNGLSECFNGHDMIPLNWNAFIKGFKNFINRYDKIIY